MDENQFWQLIEKTRHASDDSCRQQVESLQKRLTDLAADDIVDFYHLFRQFQDEAYSWHLWSAASITGAGCGDDSFTDFRAWLIGQGKKVYHQVLENPDRLADLIDVEDDGSVFYGVLPKCESLNYVAAQAYKAKTGYSLPRLHTSPRHPKGSKKDTSDWLAVYPRLAKKFGSRYDHDDNEPGN
jgi:hypothetical protein